MASTATCPVCDGPVRMAGNLVLDELLECGDCGSELVVVSLDPLGLEEAPEAEEDWGQ